VNVYPQDIEKIAAVVILDQLPRNVAGKTLKNELKENYLANQK
jgi:acyl-CoA synthetase (AMP-forming)/AMP-acid ligase II